MPVLMGLFCEQVKAFSNAFAGHLLVPDEFLMTIDDATRPADVAGFDAWLTAWRKAWGVSTEVILRRLMDSGRLSRELYRDYRSWRAKFPIVAEDGGNRKYRHREPGHIFGARFVGTVLEALYEQRITLTRASTYLDGLKIKDVKKLGEYYARH